MNTENINQEIIDKLIDRAKNDNRPSFIKINIDTLEALLISGSEVAKDIYKELLEETDEPWTKEDEADWQNGMKEIKEGNVVKWEDFEKEMNEWDREIERDCESGKLDFLVEWAKDAERKGYNKEL